MPNSVTLPGREEIQQRLLARGIFPNQLKELARQIAIRGDQWVCEHPVHLVLMVAQAIDIYCEERGYPSALRNRMSLYTMPVIQAIVDDESFIQECLALMN